MDAEEMRIAIAKKCGWTIGTEGYGWPGESIGEFRPLPNYPADLNAMHEVEKALNEDQRDEYWCLLRHSVSAGLDDMQHCFNTAHATAAQRAEAFCRVFWPERFKE